MAAEDAPGVPATSDGRGIAKMAKNEVDRKEKEDGQHGWPRLGVQKLLRIHEFRLGVAG